MSFDLQGAPAWVHMLVVYLMVGWCTQLPGGLFRRYPRLASVRDAFERHGPSALLDLAIVWIPFTILLWPVPVLRAGTNGVVLVLVIVGALSASVLVAVATTPLRALTVIALAGCIAVLIARRRRR